VAMDRGQAVARSLVSYTHARCSDDNSVSPSNR
jgi:hypothetical protein